MFTKVKYRRGETEIAWCDVASDKGATIEHRLTSSEQPRPELIAALQAFVPYVLTICELPKNYAEALTVSGVSISDTESKMGRGIVVTALKDLTWVNSPMVINTPFLSEKASATGGPAWPDEVPQLIEKLEGQAERFRKGMRAQQEMFQKAAS